MPVTFKAKLPGRVPASAAAYALPAPRVSSTTLRATAKALGLPGEGGDLTTSTDLLAYSEGRYGLEIHRSSGAVAFHHRDKYGHDPEKALTISDKRADTIARGFLKRSKIVPLGEAQLADVTHMHSAVADLKTRKVREQVTDAGVVYRRTIDGLPVDGPGGFAMVTLDPDEDVIAFRSVWRPAGKQVGKVRLKQPEEVMDAFARSVAKARGDVTVIKATLGYFELGVLDRQNVIEPVYAFVYVVHAEDVVMKSAYVVHAGEKAFGQLIRKKRFPGEAQRPRKGR